MRTKTLTAEQLAAISTQKAHDRGWAYWVAGLSIRGLTGAEREGWLDAKKNYRKLRKERIKEFDQRRQ